MQFSLRLAAILGVLLLHSVSAPAETFDPKKDAQATIQRLIDRGIETIGEFKLRPLARKLRKVTFKYKGIPGFLGAGGGRHTSIYLPRLKLVLLNEMGLRDLKGLPILEAYRVWSVHESLGALGFDDEHYGPSISLVRFSTVGTSEEVRYTSEESRVLEQEVAHLKKYETLDYNGGVPTIVDPNDPMHLLHPEGAGPLVAAKGGGTAAGGGGDITSIYVKLQFTNPLILDFYREVINQFPILPPLKKSNAEIIRTVLKLKIESELDPTYFIGFGSYRWLDSSTQSHVSLLLNRHAWRSYALQENPTRDQILEKTVNILEVLYYLANGEDVRVLDLLIEAEKKGSLQR